MDDFLIKCKPVLDKRRLHLLAGLMWTAVGVMLISLTVGWLAALTFAEALPFAFLPFRSGKATRSSSL